MNGEIGTEAAQFPEKEYINVTFLCSVGFIWQGYSWVQCTVQFCPQFASRFLSEAKFLVHETVGYSRLWHRVVVPAPPAYIARRVGTTTLSQSRLYHGSQVLRIRPLWCRKRPSSTVNMLKGTLTAPTWKFPLTQLFFLIKRWLLKLLDVVSLI